MSAGPVSLPSRRRHPTARPSAGGAGGGGIRASRGYRAAPSGGGPTVGWGAPRGVAGAAEVRQNPIDHRALDDEGEDAHRAATGQTGASGSTS